MLRAPALRVRCRRCDPLWSLCALAVVRLNCRIGLGAQLYASLMAILAFPSPTISIAGLSVEAIERLQLRALFADLRFHKNTKRGASAKLGGNENIVGPVAASAAEASGRGLSLRVPQVSLLSKDARTIVW